MDRQQGPGGGGNGCLQLLQIDQVAALLHIHKHRRRAHSADRLRGGKEAERGGDHLIARADAQAPQGQDQGIGAAVAADGMGHPTGGGEVLLKAGDRGAADVLTAAQYLKHSPIELSSQLLDLLAEAERGHLHGEQFKLLTTLAAAGDGRGP